MTEIMIDLKELSFDTLRGVIADAGLAEFRARQLAHWIYEKRAVSIDEITVLSKSLRESLSKVAFISSLGLIERLVSSDCTEKYLFGLKDGLGIESVLIPDEDRLTLCVSSQAGCPMACAFCLTGKGGFIRNLKAYEIVDQVISVERLIAPRRVTNIVMMGMGEPLKNLTEVAEALKRLTGLMKISRRRITLSTSGLAREMLELPKVAPHVNLAVSLNATTDEVRTRIMPVNRKYPLKELLEACRRYPVPKRGRITFEYVMIDGLNDSVADARRLVSLLRGIPSKVNLIPFNEFEGTAFKAPPEEKVVAFQNELIRSGLTALIRKSKGRDISAACGQLRGRHERMQTIDT